MKIGVGANRAATAASFIEKYGYLDPSTFSNRLFVDRKRSTHCCSEKIGAAILDDGMQVMWYSCTFMGCKSHMHVFPY